MTHFSQRSRSLQTFIQKRLYAEQIVSDTPPVIHPSILNTLLEYTTQWVSSTQHYKRVVADDSTRTQPLTKTKTKKKTACRQRRQEERNPPKPNVLVAKTPNQKDYIRSIPDYPKTVSYTHLTLPTIYSV